ncbi:hypothetical protein R6Q57_006408 [Mikania cordata]
MGTTVLGFRLYFILGSSGGWRKRKSHTACMPSAPVLWQRGNWNFRVSYFHLSEYFNLLVLSYEEDNTASRRHHASILPPSRRTRIHLLLLYLCHRRRPLVCSSPSITLSDTQSLESITRPLVLVYSLIAKVKRLRSADHICKPLLQKRWTKPLQEPLLRVFVFQKPLQTRKSLPNPPSPTPLSSTPPWTIEDPTYCLHLPLSHHCHHQTPATIKPLSSIEGTRGDRSKTLTISNKGTLVRTKEPSVVSATAVEEETAAMEIEPGFTTRAVEEETTTVEIEPGFATRAVEEETVTVEIERPRVSSPLSSDRTRVRD